MTNVNQPRQLSPFKQTTSACMHQWDLPWLLLWPLNNKRKKNIVKHFIIYGTFTLPAYSRTISGLGYAWSSLLDEQKQTRTRLIKQMSSTTSSFHCVTAIKTTLEVAIVFLADAHPLYQPWMALLIGLPSKQNVVVIYSPLRLKTCSTLTLDHTEYIWKWTNCPQIDFQCVTLAMSSWKTFKLNSSFENYPFHTLKFFDCFLAFLGTNGTRAI